jgi:hypothetical protein
MDLPFTMMEVQRYEGIIMVRTWSFTDFNETAVHCEAGVAVVGAVVVGQSS